MNHLLDPKIQAAAAERARAIQAGHGLSKKKALQAMERRGAEASRRWKARAELQKKVRKHQTEIVKELFGKNIKVQRELAALRQIAIREGKRKVSAPKLDGMQPRIAAGSILSILVPPYWNIWTNTSSSSASASANSTNGTFAAGATGDGGTTYGYAGIAGAFFPISDSPVGHFRQYMRYSYNWLDASVWYTAHNDAYLTAAVYDFNPAGNIVQWPPAEQSIALWQDGTGWQETHSDSGEYVWPGDLDVQFPLTPGHAYALWLWCEVVADDQGGDFWGFSYAQNNLQVACPFMVVEEGQG